ncbi:MAG: hypothetical protein K6G62_03875 [Eubacterium sp.]|nr:hypothetical protein [Eubacterium sp.]
MKLSRLVNGIYVLIWETNSRYLVAFLPMMIMVAYDGYSSLMWKNKE